MVIKMLERDWYTPVEVATMMYVSQGLVGLWLRTGKMPGHKVGGRWVIPKVKFEKWREEYEDSV
jgi:excisionase family DNA binding protein